MGVTASAMMPPALFVDKTVSTFKVDTVGNGWTSRHGCIEMIGSTQGCCQPTDLVVVQLSNLIICQLGIIPKQISLIPIMLQLKTSTLTAQCVVVSEHCY